jgi:long-chain acyl-CoA synthetase
MYKGQANILIPNPRDLPAVIKELRKYQPSFFPAVNTLFNALVNNEEFKQLDHSKLKMAMGGGMAVLPSTAEAWKRLQVLTLLKVMVYLKLHLLQQRIHLHQKNLAARLVFHYH